MTPPMIEVSNLRKIFVRGEGKIFALDGVSFTIAKGEFITITGASGSGKSTLLYILGLIDRQSSGTYRFLGNVTDGFSDDQRSELRNRQMGFIFQSFHLLPRATALHNVELPLQYARNFGLHLSKSEMSEKSAAALERVGLADRMNHLPNELSGGQSQRVAIARALVCDPSVIFADEPTGNLDSRTSAEIVELFQSLNEEGRTIIMVTHDRSLASMTKRRIHLLDGRLADEVQHAPA